MWDRMRRREFLEFLVESSRAAVSFSILALVACSRGNQQSAESKDGLPWKTLIADLEKQIPQLMEEGMVPGLSIAIIKDAKLQWRRGFGVKDSASKKPVDNDTVFEAGSMGKPVFAYAVMKLCDRGVLDLDTPLTKYMPERYLEGDPRLDLITARHVLSHTSGFQIASLSLAQTAMFIQSILFPRRTRVVISVRFQTPPATPTAPPSSFQ